MNNCIIDLDDKEHFRPYAEKMIAAGYMVTETPHGWHTPVTGISGQVSKIELFDYTIQDTKIIEIQGPKHYVLGPGCEVLAQPENRLMTYENRGSMKIYDLKGHNFHTLIDSICF